MMEEKDMRTVWEERYSEEGYLYGVNPNDFLASIDLHNFSGRVLCLAEGQGRNAVYLAKKGFDVTAVDFSEAAMKTTAALALKENVLLNTAVADLTIYPIEKESYDGIIAIFAHFNSDVRKQIHLKAIAGLKKGGFFILEAYSKNQLKYNTGGPKNIDLLYSLDDILSDFGQDLSLFIFHEMEREVIEGKLHHGKASVIQVFGIKNE